MLELRVFYKFYSRADVFLPQLSCLWYLQMSKITIIPNRNRSRASMVLFDSSNPMPGAYHAHATLHQGENAALGGN